MCGIVGILNADNRPASVGLLKKMTDIISHRGPDGEGQWTSGNVGLGHRRLAIIDLSSGAAQPMHSHEGKFTITYNGEIYNFLEIRTRLISLGHHFTSNSDTEVVLKAYVEWGSKCLDHFNGMFAFAIYNSHSNELFLARDRYGIKPLYYTVTQSGALLFASEQKVFLEHPDFERGVDKKALLEYFTFQNLFTDRNFLDGVRTFPAGHHSTINCGDNKKLYEQHNANARLPNLVQYWDFNFEEPHKPRDECEYIEELNTLFGNAVQRQLVSDVDVGAYLSGGMDSGSITAVAAGRIPNMLSFTCGFNTQNASGLELACDERAQSERLSSLFKTEHYQVVLKPGDMERCMSDLTWHLETPRVGQSYPNFYASKLASKFVKVVLAGTGGDELFGGYPWRYYRAAKNNNFDEYVDKYYKFWQRLIPNSAIRKVFSPIWGDVSDVWTRDIFESVFQQHKSEFNRPEDYINHSLYFECKTFLHGLLNVEDKLAMAQSLENRVPFLDNDLVDFAMKVPVGLKLGNLGKVIKLDENAPGAKPEEYYNKTNDGKLLLRKALSRYMPQDITTGVKQGFSAPDASWFKGESIEYVKDKLLNNNAKIYDYLDSKETRVLIDDHLTGKQNRRLLIWSLLNTEEWLNKFT